MIRNIIVLELYNENGKLFAFLRRDFASLSICGMWFFYIKMDSIIHGIYFCWDWEPSYTKIHPYLPYVNIYTNQNAEQLKLFVQPLFYLSVWLLSFFSFPWPKCKHTRIKLWHNRLQFVKEKQLRTISNPR